jgi:hypothetical protein
MLIKIQKKHEKKTKKTKKTYRRTQTGVVWARLFLAAHQNPLRRSKTQIEPE